MLKQVTLLLAACTCVHPQETSELLPKAENNQTESHTHTHVGGEDITCSGPDISGCESAYFLNAFLKKYGDSKQLSLDGFARLFCGLGLMPSFAETTNEADDISHGGHGTGKTAPSCKDITYKELQAIFDQNANKRLEHDHGPHEHHDHAVDDHHDHDHQPNRNTGVAGVSLGQGGDPHHYDSHNSGDHADHAHNHEGSATDSHQGHDHPHTDVHVHDHSEDKSSEGHESDAGSATDSHQGHDHPHTEDHLHDHESDAGGATDSHQGHDHPHADDHLHDHSESSTSSPELPTKRKRSVQDTSVSLTKSNSAAGGTSSTVHHHSVHGNCTSPKDLLQLFHIPLGDLSPSDFVAICPALLYQLDLGACASTSHDHDHTHDDHDHAHDHQDPVTTKDGSFSSIPAKVWGFSIAAVMVISLGGLLGVAVIPIMRKVFYNHLLQFLVAVAVGALSGDALLHLLPHAIAKNQLHGENDDHGHGSHDDHSDDAHLESVWKGLVALLCIFFFFLIERILTIVTEKKRRRKSVRRVKKKRCEELCDKEGTAGVGAKLAAHDEGDFNNCDEMVMVVHPNRALKAYADATHEVMLHECDNHGASPAGMMGGGGARGGGGEEAGDAGFETDQDNPLTALGGHGHSHHGHGHTVPGSVAAVAWMVILGDGIHNFSDGLAIGAAFAGSVTGGVSTSVAVLCHELPHEIGDFAVLLRAGMSIKQAIVYNCVSSVLCFIGMVFGVAIGNIHNASLWVFSGVAGMFLYISMVDMLPEMTAVDTKKGENQYLHLLLQVCGMMIGAGIMLVIAVYEHDLQRSLG